MKFHYEFEVKKFPGSINHEHALFLIGSCFTENIGEKLRQAKFRVLENPHGILFNPASVTDSILDCIRGEPYGSSDLFQFNEGWHSWKHHSRFSDPDPQVALAKMNSALQIAHDSLKSANVILITLGSAFGYRLTSEAAGQRTGMIAANNHKAPASWFQRRLMPVDEILAMLDEMLHRLFMFNPSIRVIFTISPVRHLREGVVENNRSKAALIQAVHHLAEKLDRIYYFPAYELVIDDLRDYRFYAEDLVHPNYAATEYVWEKFKEACLSPASIALIEKLKPLLLAVRHKPFNVNSAQHKKFLQSSFALAQSIQEEYPHLDLSRELEFLKTS